MRDFKELKVWKKSHEIAIAAYQVTTPFPAGELYGLTNQIRRAASSVPANIAEGCGRDGKKEFARFLNIALGSANELQYHLVLSRDLGYLETLRCDEMLLKIDEVKKMLVAFVKRLKANG